MSLTTTLVREGEVARLTLRGTADLMTLEKLQGAVAEARAVAGVARTMVDLTELEFASSSALKVFVEWIVHVAEGGSGQKIHFVSNAAYAWQRRSLVALRALASDVVVIDPAAPPT